MALAYVASFASGDPDRIASHVTADFWNEHTSALGRSGRGRVEYRRRLPAFLADFAGLRYDVEDVVAEGDRVVVAYTMRARWQGHDVAVRGVFRLRIEDGLVAHRADYWDGLDFQRQTGPRPDGPAVPPKRSVRGSCTGGRQRDRTQLLGGVRRRATWRWRRGSRPCRRRPG